MGIDGITPDTGSITPTSSNDPFVRPDPDAPLPRIDGMTKPPDGHTFLVAKTESCTWCHRTMDFLKALHEARGDFNVAVLDANAQPDAFRQVSGYTRRTTVPQIFLDGKFVGGFRELADAAHRGQLDAYLDGGDWEGLRPAQMSNRRLLARFKRKKETEEKRGTA